MANNNTTAASDFNGTSNAPNSISNSSLRPIEISMLMLSCVIAILSNVFVLYLILTVRRLKTVTNVFVFSICMCNIMFAGLLLPVHCFFQESQPILYNIMVLITILIYISNLTAVSYDRLVSITKPMLYTLKQTKVRAVKIVILVWTLPLGYALLPLIWYRDKHESHKELAHKIYTSTTLVLFLLGPLFFIIFVYCKVCVEMKRMNRFKRKSLTPLTNIFTSCEETNNTKKKRNLLHELKTLPQKLLHNMREETLRHSRRYRNRKKTSTSYRRDTVLSTIETQQPKIVLTEASPRTEEKQRMRKKVSIHHSVTYIANGDVDNHHPDKEVCNELVKASLGKSNGRCPKKFSTSSNDYDDDSDVETLSISSRKTNCSMMTSDVTSSPRTRKRASSISKMKRKAYELKASLAFLIVAITYMFTWLPVVVMTFNDVLGSPLQLPASLSVINVYTIAVNALSDPFLYGLLLPNFRKTLKIMVNRLRSRRR